MKKSALSLVSLFVLLAVFLALPRSAPAATYVRIADAHLADQAAAIAEIRVLSVDPSPAAGVATDYSVEVVDLISGYVPGGAIVVRVAGGPGLYVPGAPHFVEGQTALLFLATRADGTYGIQHLMLGAFQIAELDGRRLAYRDLSQATEILPPGKDPAPEQLRDLERFRAWLADHTRGNPRDADYWLEVPAGFVPPTHEKYALLGPGRWTQFDSGGSVHFRAHASGQPGQPGDGFTEFQRGLAAWTNHETTPIRYLYDGTTTSTAGFSGPDGTNAILFGDPNADIDGTYDCSQGGTLAAGGFYPSSQTSNHNGTSFVVILEGDIVTNDGIECELPGNRLAEEVFAHELGHTLGLGHSSNSGALMWPFAHNDGRGARLSTDDKNGIIFIYGDPPTAPSELAAESRDDGILLTWRDNSNDESKFEVFRSAGGGFSKVRETSANTTSWLDTGVGAGITYTYRVRGANAAGRSDFSNDAAATAPGFAAPGDLTAVTLSASQIELSWRDDTDDEIQFQIEGKTGEEPFALIATVPADTETTVIGGLAMETTYTFRARALGPEGFSAYSNEADATTFGAPCECVEGPTTMCLDGGRFRIEASWGDFDNNVGPGQVVDFGSNNSGLLWFFSPENWEMLIKVLDGCAINDRFWMFAAATTDVEYTLGVTDCWAGVTALYTNPLGNASPAITDTDAFATCSALPPPGFAPQAPGFAPLSLTLQVPGKDLPSARAAAVTEIEATGIAAVPEKQGDCVPGNTELCLDDSRFLVEVEWQDFEGNVGSGKVVATDSPNSGLLWFFSANNWEMLIKVLDGCSINDHYCVFSAATTDVQYTLRVTDTESGEVSIYQNALGNAAAAITDTAAFQTCP